MLNFELLKQGHKYDISVSDKPLELRNILWQKKTLYSIFVFEQFCILEHNMPTLF